MSEHAAHSDGGHGAHHHQDAHGHGHAHGHHQHAAPSGNRRTFVIAIALNSLFVVAEFVYGFIAHSTSLMADAGHNLSDVLGLTLALAASVLQGRLPSVRYTYGLRSTSILAALANAMLLLVACGAIGWEAVQRLAQPPAVQGLTVMVVASLGILVNGLSAWLFVKGRHEDLNVRGAYLHMAADAAVSLGVVAGGGVMLLTGWWWVDPAISLVLVAVIVAGTWGLLREALHLALDAVPRRIDLQAVDGHLRRWPGVADIHDLHIWGMSTTENALTVHLVMPDGHPGDAVVDALAASLDHHFQIHHCTLQIDLGTTEHRCSLSAVQATAHAH